VANLAAKAAQNSPVRVGSTDSDNLTEAQMSLLNKYVKLLQGRPLVEKEDTQSLGTPMEEKDTDTAAVTDQT